MGFRSAGQHWLLLIVIALVVGSGCSSNKGKGKPEVPEEDAAAEDVKKLQGTWHVTKFDTPGRNSDGPPRGMTFEFQENRFTFRTPDEEKDPPGGMTYTLNSSKNPKWIDLDFGKAGGTAAGIYKLDDDELTICLRFRNEKKEKKEDKATDGKKGEDKKTDGIKREAKTKTEGKKSEYKKTDDKKREGKTKGEEEEGEKRKGEEEKDVSPATRPSVFRRRSDTDALWVMKRAGGESSTPDESKPSSPEDNLRAKELFQSMESRIVKAKTVRCGFSTEFLIQGGGGTAGAGGGPPTDGTLVFTEGNKVRLKIEETADPDIEAGEIVSNGIRMRGSIWREIEGKGKDKSPKGKNRPPETPEVKKTPEIKTDPRLTAVLAAMLSRVGLYHRFLREIFPEFEQQPGKNLPPFNADKTFPVSDFKLGRKEKVGGREAQVVTFQLALRLMELGGRPVQVKVWIDIKTNLPLKRELIVDGGALRFTDTYTDMKLDEKLDPRLFELPK